ncbi:T9SS type A sorting domain-containing protein [Crocinitomix algicola]|uniref:T9SS type A sorting domain-containing protein n=1 Tax=Crocinitomix algicola TaxID=1740263 RepID=UPI000872D23C|nr:T9SS type A sorting domain-containing protein [Crocinitomix algicola]
MNKLFTSIAVLALGFTSYGQMVFESDLSSWTDGNPDGWMGSKTSIDPENVTEIDMGAEHGTSMAQLINASGSHKRFTTEEVAVTELLTYEIKIWLTGAEGSELRSGFYNATEEGWFYNDYIDVYAETAGEITMVSQSVTMPEGCEAAEFILSVRNTDELIGIMIDSVAIGVGEPVIVEEVSIYDIQYAPDAPHDSPYAEEVVKTTGIVTGVFQFGSDEGKFFIQDGEGAWNGIYVYADGSELSLGDEVTVTGKVVEYYGLTEMSYVSEINVLSSDNELPAPVDVSTLDAANEEYEAVLVRVLDAECTNADAGFGQFEVNDGSGARLIDDQIYSYTATMGNFYNITGVTFLSFDEVKIFPRMEEDVVTTGAVGVEENEAALSFFPNPASDFITVAVNPNAQIEIFSMTGEKVYSANGNVKQINVAQFETGIYQIIVRNDAATTTHKLMVK